MKAQENIQILFIDYITLIGSEHPDLPRHEQIAEVSRSLKALARELDIPVVVLSQVSRDAEGHAPTLANIRESGSIEQDADVVLFLHRERGSEQGQAEQSDSERMQVIVAKQRNGPVGDIELAFIKRFTTFAAMERHARM
jgi:replicative DNA helicase